MALMYAVVQIKQLSGASDPLSFAGPAGIFHRYDISQ